MEHRRLRARPSRSSPTSCCERLSDRFGPRRPAALRPGQVVSGRAAAALGARPATGGATASRSGAARGGGRRTRRRRRRPTRWRLIQRLAARLGVDPALVLPAREDPLHWIKAEGDLPDGRGARATTALDDAGGRATPAPGDGRAGSPSRSAMCCRCAGRWRRPRATAGSARPGASSASGLFLVPGDSPVGLRLPLGSLPAREARGLSLHHPARSLRGARAAADVRRDLRGAPTPVGGQGAPAPKAPIVRTALSVEPRDGVPLCLHAAGGAAGGLSGAGRRSWRSPPRALPVRIEGYTPPDDLRMGVLKVTPDPGVIEVNVQPAANWREAVAITTGVYEDARACRLGADKFMIDGRHTGTGGGAHVVVGGASPDELALPAPAGRAEEPAALLAAPSGAFLPVLRPVHRPDQPGAAGRRGAPRRPLRTRHRAGA